MEQRLGRRIARALPIALDESSTAVTTALHAPGGGDADCWGGGDHHRLPCTPNAPCASQQQRANEPASWLGHGRARRGERRRRRRALASRARNPTRA